MTAACRIRPAGPDEMDLVRELFREYQASLGIDLCFQSFEEELATLPGRYAPPAGLILLADPETSGPIGGIVAFRALDPFTAEMKRLYVRPAWRGSGLGKALCLGALRAAAARGYSRLRLDTLPQMDRAIDLYRRLGFQEIEAYTRNPVPGALYFDRDLSTEF